MTYISDLSTELYSEPPEAGYRYLSVGWLGKTVPSKGKTALSALEKLRWLRVENINLNGMWMGEHECEICQNFEDTSEFYVPHGETRYILPGMVFHYIEDHGYALPECVLEALDDIEIPETEYVISHAGDKFLERIGFRPVHYDTNSETLTVKTNDGEASCVPMKMLEDHFKMKVEIAAENNVSGQQESRPTVR